MPTSKHVNVRENNPNWGGGKTSTGRYLKLLIPGHPRSNPEGYVHEHIVVAEKALGRNISVNNPVHHHDGDSHNNDSSNLVICESNAYHKLLHARARSFKATGNVHSKRCHMCGEWKDISDFYTNTERCKKCNTIYMKKYRMRCRDKYNEYQRNYRKEVKDVSNA